METTTILFLLITLIVILTLFFVFFSFLKLTKLIENNNLNITKLKIEIEKFDDSEKILKHQLRNIKADQLQFKKEALIKESSNLNQITSFSELNHDIRTQLNGIIAFSILLETEFTNTNNKELLEFATNIRICGENLLKLFS